jgi:hypothetical protein
MRLQFSLARLMIATTCVAAILGVLRPADVGELVFASVASIAAVATALFIQKRHFRPLGFTVGSIAVGEFFAMTFAPPEAAGQLAFLLLGLIFGWLLGRLLLLEDRRAQAEVATDNRQAPRLGFPK